MKLGLIGYGTIGSTLARAIADGIAGDVSLAAVLDVYDEPPFEQTAEGPVYTNSIASFLSLDLDVVVEAASQAVLKEYAALVLRSGKNLIPMSAGAFADEGFFLELRQLASENQCRVFIPSGAVGGLDAISAAVIDDVDEITLTTTKPVQALAGAESVIDPQVNLDSITTSTCIYEGCAEDAVKKFPKNVNVAAALSLAGIGANRTTVRILADPQVNQNIHRIEARGAFGELRLDFKNAPSPTNPKTSYLAALSAIRLVKNLTEPVKVGT